MGPFLFHLDTQRFFEATVWKTNLPRGIQKGTGRKGGATENVIHCRKLLYDVL